MFDNKIIIARIWPVYESVPPSRVPVILGINPEKYETIVIYLGKNSNSPNIFAQNGKKVFYMSGKKSVASLSPLMILRLARLLKQQKVDIVHCHKHKASVYGVLAAKLAGVPIRFSHVHGLGRSRNFKRRLLNRLVLNSATKILAVSDAVKKDILKNNTFLKFEKVISLGNSIDYEKFSNITKKSSLRKDVFGIENGSFVFATAGRLAETKGQIYLIRAFAHLNKVDPNTRLLIAGKGSLEKQLCKEAERLGCKETILFLGQVGDMPAFYSSIDAFILPSIAEGLPRVLLEAMAAGVLPAGTDAGGIPEVLDNGRFGEIVPAKNQQALTDAMLKIMQKPEEEKSRLSQAVKNHIGKYYSHPIVIKRLERVYGQAVEKKIIPSPAVNSDRLTGNFNQGQL